MSIARHHNEWLSLVPNSGPFLSLPVLAQAFPQGLDAHDADHARRLRLAFDEWDDNQLSKRPDPAMHRAWIKLVLSETLGYDEQLAEGQAISQTLKSDVAEYGETLRPNWIVNDPATNKARLLVQIYPRSQSLTKPVPLSRWKISPDTRMMQLLHDTDIRLGIVTNGDHWMLVNAPKNETTGYVSWYANLWLEEPITLRAFRTMLGADRFFSVPENETLEALLDKSADDQQEVTDQLGYQVRKAVEVLVQAIDKADQEHGRKLLDGVDEKVLYESALTVMMRLVFLFCAEERELLLLGDDLYDKNYAVSTLREQLRVAADQFGEEILGLRYDAWPRLITSFRAVYGGVKHHRLKIPAYGGSLFNPDRFPFLEGRKLGTSWKTAEAMPLPISNRTVLHLLEALQVLQVRLPGGGAAEARKLSFRSLDIEQIGHVYEGLLDHTAKRATEPMLGLQGTRDKEPEIAVSVLERQAWGTDHAKLTDEQKRSTLHAPPSTLLKFLKDETGRSESALKKALNVELDDQLAGRFATSCQDSELWKRVKPFAGLVRLDTVDYPVVITPGSVFVTGGTDRRSSGTHYTPKSLTEPIVQYTLEPLVYIGPAEGLPKDQWKLRSAKELLDLKICDMACGSGAFLVQACRYMAARLLEAWDQVERRAQTGQQGNFLRPTFNGPRTLLRITPYGLPSEGNLLEQFVPLDPDERQAFALRIVAQRCVYGVDKNPLAAEMAKLSLWLLTLAKDKPFTFLDHAIRSGDSLVGVDAEQLKTFSLDGKGVGVTLPNFLNMIPKIMEATRIMRVRLEKISDEKIADVEEKERLFANIQQQTKRLNYAADRLIAATWKPAKPAERTSRLKDALREVDDRIRDVDPDVLKSDGSARREEVGCPQPFHWAMEFPEVFMDRSGFDAFVGNPPFMGGTFITGTLGVPYREYLVETIADGRRGNADLCAYFFLRSDDLLMTPGHMGFLATNTIAQGDTREVALDFLTMAGCVISRAVPSRPWPGTANLEIAHVWLRRGSWSGSHILNDASVMGITSYLGHLHSVSGTPHVLRSNDGRSFNGAKVYGQGFLMSGDEAALLIRSNRRNKDVLLPYLNGEDLATRPDQSPSRWTINFFDWPIAKAKEYSECFRIVEDTVKPERMQNNRKERREKWWQYGERCPALYRTISGMERVLVIPETTKYCTFSFSTTEIVFSHMVKVIAFSSFSAFAILASTIHEDWARNYSSTLETRLKYNTSDAFETFPLPVETHRLNSIGENYHSYRRQIMLRQNEGITKTYNRFHGPDETSSDIQKLRDLHVEMDNAVAAACGWTDLDLGHGFHETKQGVRFSISEPARREVLARLLKLNHERYAEEVKQGLHEKSGGGGRLRGEGSKSGGRGQKKAKATADEGPTLFDQEGDE